MDLPIRRGGCLLDPQPPWVRESSRAAKRRGRNTQIPGAEGSVLPSQAVYKNDQGIYHPQPPGRRAPESSPFSAPRRLSARLFPGPSGKPANSRPTTQVPFPTSTRLCHKARGCAGRRTTPGPGRITFPTPKGVVPSFRLGTTPREHHGTYLSHRDAKHPNPVSSSRLGVFA